MTTAKQQAAKPKPKAKNTMSRISPLGETQRKKRPMRETQNWKARARKLVGYAVHDEDCSINKWPIKPCDCGLSKILQECKQ